MSIGEIRVGFTTAHGFHLIER